MITKAEALIITNNAKYLKNHKNEAQLIQLLKSLENNIRAAAEHGQNRSVWTTGNATFIEEIENTLTANGFEVIYDEGSYLIKWGSP
jgi:hypothetical protein